MSDDPASVLSAILELANELSLEPDQYLELTRHQRAILRKELEAAVLRLTEIAQAIDLVRQPEHVFDPTHPKVIGRLVAETLLLQDREELECVARNPFYGAGVYAIYYRGSFDAYSPISGTENPIYVGKADPAQLHAGTPQAQGTPLFTRLKDHQKTIESAENLDLQDFQCRFLVVRNAWVETAEDLLINRFRPVWNKEMKVCQGFGKHGDSASTRSNRRSPWDTLHAGRRWATSDGNTPGRKTAEQIRSDIADHYQQHPPRD